MLYRESGVYKRIQQVRKQHLSYDGKISLDYIESILKRRYPTLTNKAKQDLAAYVGVIEAQTKKHNNEMIKIRVDLSNKWH